MIKGCTIIMLFYFLGELFSHLIMGLIPGSVCGMVFLFLSLMLKLISPADIEGVANVLTKNMALFFVPAAVGIIPSFGLISKYWIALLIVSVLTTIGVIVVVGYLQDKLEKKI